MKGGRAMSLFTLIITTIVLLDVATRPQPRRARLDIRYLKPMGNA